MMTQINFNGKNRYKVKTVEVTYRKDSNGVCFGRIYLPEKQGPFPALIDVHGGAWSKGGYTDNEKIDWFLAEKGMAVFAIEFRKAPDYTYPAQVMDLNLATRWLKLHARDYDIQPDCIGGLGTSSGGHTLLLSAMRPDDDRYNKLELKNAEGLDARLAYLIAAWPVIDPYGRFLFAKANKLYFLQDASLSYFLDETSMKEANPLLMLERAECLDLPPVLIIQGTADKNVPIATVDRFARAYNKAGGCVDIQWFKNMPHGFACQSFPESDIALDIIENFIANCILPKHAPQDLVP
jgi:acetyl esterase/lipase